MKLILRAVVFVFVSQWAFQLNAASGPRAAQWQKVQDAISRGLPQTAITNLEPIIRGALQDKAYAEAVKAIGERIALEGNIQGNKPEEKITRLQAELAKAPPEMTPMLETLLAHWYWQYFQQNNWRFIQRTATAAPPGNDFTTWDLPRIFAEIDSHFQKALAAEKFLKATPVSTWDELLQKGTMPDSLRPTLYDFIAHEALQFYTSGEQAGAKPEDAFELSAESPVLGSATEFMSWNPGQAATNSAALRAISIFKQLLRFHQNDAPPRLAFADVDLERLTWAWNSAFGENKDARYKAALEQFIKDYADFEISALALEREARVFQQQDNLVTARQLAQRGAQAFPNSPGGKLCRNLINEIEAKAAAITTERVWNCFAGQTSGPCPTLTVHYRNIEAVYFKAISYDWETFLEKRHNRPESLSEQERREVLAKAPALEWSEKLTPTSDYKQKSLTFVAPTNLPPGFYFIAASHNPAFSEKENIISMTPVWVSDLSLVTRSREGRLEGFVLDANSGEPFANAQISRWYLDQTGSRVAESDLTTDENGFFSFKPSQGRPYLLRARHHEHQVANQADLWAYEWQVQPQDRALAQTIFFTDRSIYRPGQTIQYKGICLWVDQSKDNYEVLKGERLTVLFRDPNGKEIARQQQRANDFGSFTGSFTAPRDRLMGQMSLLVEGRATGQAVVRVEEYKRPKFEVTLDAPKTAARLNEKASLSGHAMSYTGAAVDGAQVKYHVVREVRMPWWWGWWRGGWRQPSSQEIAHGTLRTETDGSFKVEFSARPDPKVPEKDEPTFVFQVNADVTDSAGETRSAGRAIRVGYTALEATLSANDWETEEQPVELTLATRTLDDEPQVAEGSVKIYELQAPDHVQRTSLDGQQVYRSYDRYSRSSGESSSDQSELSDSSDPNNWPLGKVQAEQGFTTDTNGTTKLSFKLPAGIYRAIVETQDRFGKKVTGRLPLQVLKPQDTHLAIKIPHVVAAPKWQAHPGEEFMALWGTGYEVGRAFIEIEHRHQMLERYWTKPEQTQQQLKLAVTEAMRGGFTLHVTQVRENRAYLDSHRIDVPWDNKDLELSWEHFVSKLKPGQKETWTFVVKPKTIDTNASSQISEKLAAEMVATLYDESLDAFNPHYWSQGFGIFRQDYSNFQSQFANMAQQFQHVFGSWGPGYETVQISYRAFPPDLVANLWGYAYFGGGGGRRSLGRAELALQAPMAALAEESLAAKTVNFAAGYADGLQDKLAVSGAAGEPKAPTINPDLSKVAARKNLNETAFFFPQLTSDSNGVVRMTFTMPEALTKWRFMAFAHDQSVRSGYIEGHTVTAKDIMVQPNPPRFLREGDTIEFIVKISNQSEQVQDGTVRLTFDDALQTNSSATTSGTKTDRLLNNLRPDQTFSIPAKQSRSFSWRITVPDGCGFLTYKAVAATATLSDGEEGAIPVLSRRILVTESLPLPIRGPGSKKFEFTRLLKSGSSKTLQNQSLTLQMVSHPAWYAVLALPYLMEYPYECSEQTFNRLYANALARMIAGSDPKIHRIFEQWRNTPALDSPLEKNQDLKSVALEETPWLRQAQAESQARRNVGILFDDNRLNYELEHTMEKLTQMQLPDGSWPWFPSGRGNDYITLYITTGFGRLRHLGVDVQIQPALRSLNRLDSWMNEHYERIQKSMDPQKYVPSATDALYLYGRSFFLKEQSIAAPNKTAVDFFLAQARKFWLQTDCRQTQGQLALALQRFNAFNGFNDSTPSAILASLRERSVSNEEMGMFWRDTELSWWWYRAPIETQALMIEAFDEVARDAKAVEECKVWLLKQKQTQDWKTTKATADAVYALLLKGRELLSSDALVEVKLDGLDVTPGSAPTRSASTGKRSPVEPGTGFYEVRFTPSEIKPKLGDITVHKPDNGVAWGSLNWQYLEDMSKVTPYQGTPLKLRKTLFTKTATTRGQVLEPVKREVKVGDELVVRIELRVDRDMEYVHLKDQRGSGTEPLNVLSSYRYQDGLAYYESTRDTASHFFIDYLPKGTYVFEYSTRVQLRGQYQTGLAEIQCMYAPEFNSHSESVQLSVQ